MRFVVHRLGHAVAVEGDRVPVDAVPALLPFATGYVDVRDVASLQLLALVEPAAVGERFIATSGRSLCLRDVAAILRDRLGDRAAKVPTKEMPLWAARGLAKVDPQLRQLRAALGRNLDATSAKAERLLGWKPRPIEDTSPRPPRACSPSSTELPSKPSTLQRNADHGID